jgi:hypothetical protein
VTAAPGRDGYLAFLVARDGEPDSSATRWREAFFAALEGAPVRSALPVDREAFLRHLRRRRPEPDLDDRLLSLLASAKANQAERFGVGLAELYGRIGNTSDPVRPRAVRAFQLRPA